MAMLLALSGCARSNAAGQLPDVPADIKKQLPFVCTHENSQNRPRDAEADHLYRHARWLVRHNTLKQDSSVYPVIERLVRIATAYGHDKANIELRRMIERTQAVSADPTNEVLDLVQDLIKRGFPAGYYDMGWYLEHGYGAEADAELAFRYYRKSADMGSPDGQYLVGGKLDKSGIYGEEIAAIGQEMQRCAADQGHAKSAQEYAISARQDGKTAEAAKYYQLAVKAGNSSAALVLSNAFSERNDDEIFNLGQATDPERESRYKSILKFLAAYDYLNAKVPELEELAPWPPMKLPSWYGKFKWLEEHKANVPPPLPTEERIAEMAKAKGLDPKTGRRTGASK
jgi:TPR repeat protein